MDLTFLPFDSQICKIEIINLLMSGLLGRPKVLFKVERNEVEVGLFQLNKGWKLTKSQVSKLWFCSFYQNVQPRKLFISTGNSGIPSLII